MYPACNFALQNEYGMIFPYMKESFISRPNYKMTLRIFESMSHEINHVSSSTTIGSGLI